MKKTKQYISRALLMISLILIMGVLLSCSTDTASADNSSSNNSGGGTSSTYSINVTGANGTTDFIMSGSDADGALTTTNDPDIQMYVGESISFVVNVATIHPFEIQENDGTPVTGATDQGTTSGTVTWTPTSAGARKYQCMNHSRMTGVITVSVR